MNLLYNLAVSAYIAAINIASLFDPKADKWVKGRKGLITNIKSCIAPNENIIWFHCASLGEFEQGRPVIEAFKKKFPDFKILLTFFSPSGYEIRKNYSGADWVFYLPADTPKNAKAFVNAVNPKLAIFVKYEFWHNYISELHERQIPLLLISAKFRKDQPFFKFYGSFFRKILQNIHHIFVQDESSLILLENIGIKNTSLAGDTRFDRVFETAAQNINLKESEFFSGGLLVIVAGSTWPPDEQILKIVLQQFKGKFKLIIAPHEVNENTVSAIKKLFADFSTELYSEIDRNSINNSEVLIIDNIGMLSKLYSHAAIAYVGGGFGKSIHNTLEPAAFGAPVIFGPRYHKFKEAVELIEKGGAFSINNSEEAIKIMLMLEEKNLREKAAKIAQSYVSINTGATSLIIKNIESLLFQK
jgi:3-deoxy-D-manno-octulosonic-acid transferase